MAISLRVKFLILHATTHLCALFGVIWVFKTGEFQWLILSYVGYLYAGIVGVNVALHRYFSHASFRTSRIGYWVLLVSSVLPMLGSTVAWGSIHIHHHTHSDTDADPHNPSRNGNFKSWFTIWPNADIPLSIFRTLARDKRALWLHEHYFLVAGIYVLALALIDWRLVPFLFAIPAVGCFHGAAAIAVIPHTKRWGNYRTYETADRSENSFLASFLSLGEGWHNNHHHNPKNYRQGEKWWELDPAAFIIKNFLRVQN